jgi:tRNA-dihydrouridine synthase C
VVPVHAGGRLKQWLALLRRNYPEAEALYQRLAQSRYRRLLLVEAGILKAGA